MWSISKSRHVAIYRYGNGLTLAISQKDSIKSRVLRLTARADDHARGFELKEITGPIDFNINQHEQSPEFGELGERIQGLRFCD